MVKKTLSSVISVRGKNVLLIEDVTTSGGSALYGIEALRQPGHGPTALSRLLTANRGRADARGARRRGHPSRACQ